MLTGEDCQPPFKFTATLDKLAPEGEKKLMEAMRKNPASQ
jgi:hypothetical protein